MILILKLFRTRRKKPGSLPSELADLRSTDQLRAILERERARADRSGQGFALLKFAAPDEAASRETLVSLARILKARLRCTDETGWLDDGQIGVVLPCTDAGGARSVANDVRQSFGPAAPPHCEIYCYPKESAQPGNGHSNGRSNGNGHKNGHDDGPSNGHANRSADDGATDAALAAMEPHFAQSLSKSKRALDILGAGAAMIVAAPVMIAAALAVKLTSRGPVLYKQLRAGHGGNPFWMYKFRTMLVNADALKAELLAQNEMDGPAFKIKNDPRITPIGRFLRRSSIDELPQLWHVLTGEMSLVGPRAMAWHEFVDCQVWQRRRLDVTPGLTCIWQVYGRARVSFNDWMRMDLQYVDKQQSLTSDLKLMAATVPAVLFGEGAY